jgi:hypothetical protein
VALDVIITVILCGYEINNHSILSRNAVIMLSETHHRYRNQKFVEEICNQQKNLQDEEHSLILHEFPHLKAQRESKVPTTVLLYLS